MIELAVAKSTMKLPQSSIPFLVLNLARYVLASTSLTENTSSTPSSTNNLLSEPTDIFNPADQSMLMLHEFPVENRLITNLHFYKFEEKQSRKGDRYWAFLYREVFDQPQKLGRTLVRGPRRAYHVECAFLEKPGNDYVDDTGDVHDDDDDGRTQSKDVEVDEDGLVEKMHFRWSELVVADEPYDGIVCRMYFDLDDLKFGQDVNQPYYRSLTWT